MAGTCDKKRIRQAARRPANDGGDDMGGVGAGLMLADDPEKEAEKPRV
jgi:hypothetical protein